MTSTTDLRSQVVKVNSKDGGIKNKVYYDFSQLADAEKFEYINSVCMIQLELAYALKRADFLFFTSRKLINVERLKLKSDLDGVILGNDIVKMLLNISFSFNVKMLIEETVTGIKVTSPLFVCDDHIHSVYLFKDSVYHFEEASLASKKYFLAGLFKRQLELLSEKGKFIETIF